MHTKRQWIRGVLALAVVPVLAGSLTAGQGEQRMSDEPSQNLEARQRTYSPTSDVRLRKATELIGSPVKNPEGQFLGRIYDLVLTPNLDEVSYVALSRGGIFGIGRNLYAIPWSTIRLGAEGDLVAPVSQTELTQWRGFRPSAWPSDPAQSWVRGIPRTTTRMQSAVQTDEENQSVQNRRVSRIRGTNVKTPEGLSAGEVRDLVIAMDDGAVEYTVVSFGGMLGLGLKHAAVPQDAIDIQPDRRVAQLSVGRDVLQTQGFAPSQFPDLGDPSYARSLDRAYSTETGDTVLGYVPAEEPKRDSTAPSATRPQTSPTRETAMPGATPHTPATGGAGAIRIDPGIKYNSAAARTIQGVVTAVMKSARTDAGSEILLLQVRTGMGELFTVHAGPLDYVGKQDFYAVTGDNVAVVGSPAPGSDGLFLAARITRNGQILQLRDRDGKPVWERTSQEKDSQQQPNVTTPTPAVPEGAS